MLSNSVRKTMRDLEALVYYAKKFERLRVDRAHGIAPHKPILLLSVIEQIKRGVIKTNEIYLTPELIQTFLKYWSYLGSFAHNPDISKPFFYMKSGKFWHLWTNQGYEKIINSKEKLKTFAEVKRAIKFAYLDEDLFDFLQDSPSRSSLINVLAVRWFSGQVDLIEKISQTDKFKNPQAVFKNDYKFYNE